MARVNRITREMVAAFRAGDRYELHYVLLKRAPWQVNPMDATSDQPPACIAQRGQDHAQNSRTWAEARRIRLALEEAAR